MGIRGDDGVCSVQKQRKQRSNLRNLYRPLLGGPLSHPQEHFPKIFGGTFWKEYPYFLPCLVTASYVLFAFLITLFFFREVRKFILFLFFYPITGLSQTVDLKKQQDSQEVCNDPKYNEKPLPLRKIFVYPVVLSISNYAALAFLNIAISALLPLFLAMPLEIGGLGFDPPKIGYIIGSYGAASAIFQAIYFSRIIRHFGVKKVFVLSMSTLIPIFLSFPAINIAAVAFGRKSPLVWVLILILLSSLALLDIAYGVAYDCSTLRFLIFFFLGPRHDLHVCHCVSSE